MNSSQITTLHQTFNGLPSPNYTAPEIIFKELLSLHKNKPVNPTNMRNLVRLTVSRRASRIQISNFHVITRVADMLIKEAAPPRKLEYHNLALQVNEIINSRRRGRG